MNRPTETAERIIRDVCAGRPCLSSCLARVRSAPPFAACPPPGAVRTRTFTRWALGALAVVAVALLAFRAFGEVRCIWNGSGYDCSGEGDQIIVYPGVTGEAGVITNSYGCCTNCTAIDPMTLSNLFLRIRSEAVDVYDASEEVRNLIVDISISLGNTSREIDGYQNSGYFESQSGVVDKYLAVSNYLWTVDNDQTLVVRSMSIGPGANTTQKQRLLIANDAIYLYATGYVKPKLDSEVSWLQYASESSQDASAGARTIINYVDETLPLLAATPDCSSLSNGCSDVTGKWCTEEQGDAIIDLLKEQRDYLFSISNHCEIANGYLSGLYRTFMNLRGGIPSEDSLDKSWQDIYLSNSTGSFAYGYTNVAERIELLLYGLSGVGTNTQLFTSLDGAVGRDETAQSEYDRVTGEFDGLDASFETGAQNMDTLFGKLQGLFSAFSGLVGRTLSPNEEYISTFSFHLGDDSVSVPAVTAGGEVSIANQLQTLCRAGMIGIYWLVAGILGVKFYLWFFSKVVYFLRWSWELLQGLFS